jgi:hypothetical protein
MGFEVYVQCFDHGAPGGAPRAAIRALFPVSEAESEPDYWLVWYDEIEQCRFYISALKSDAALVECVCVDRPCGDMRLWDGLLEVMRMGPAALYFPGSAPPLVASEAAAAHLPPDMIESMGQPLVVRSGQEILDIIHKS